jgi:hypothetical protein
LINVAMVSTAGAETSRRSSGFLAWQQLHNFTTRRKDDDEDYNMFYR